MTSAESRTGMWRRVVVPVYLAVGSIAAVGYYSTPAPWQEWWYDLPALLAVLACVDASRRQPPYRLPWLLFGCGIACFVVGDEIYAFLNDSFPGPSDIAYLGGYPLLAVATATSIRRRVIGALAAFLDAALVTAAASLFVFLFWLEPLLTANSSETPLFRGLTVAYPLGDLLLLATLTAVMLRAVRHNWILLATMLLLLSTDLTYSGMLAHGSYNLGSYVDGGWIGFYTLVGVSALRLLREETRADAGSLDRTGLSWQRLALAGLCLFAVPAAAAVEILVGYSVETGDLISWSAVIGALTCARFALVARERHRSEEHFQALIETTNDLVYIVDDDGVIRYMSPSVERVLGLPPCAYVGRSAFEFAHPDDLDEAREGLEALLRGETPGLTIRTLASSGTYRHLHITARMLERGPWAGALLVNAHDVTRRTEMEAELAAKDEQLRQSQKMEAIGRLAGGIAHDFNNLLTAITGYSDLARAKTAEPGTAADLDEIRSAADRAANLTRQLLAFSRQQIMQPQPVELNRHIRGLENLLRRLIGEHIAIDSRYTEQPIWVEVDPGQLEQVVINLAVNARDAMPNGGVLGLALTAAGADAVLAIEDTGCGMDDETRRHAFDPFYTTKAVGAGTGLGLATVFGIVTQSGGDVTIASELGVGSSVTVVLPRIEPPIEEDIAPTPPAATTGRARRILLVEDEAQVRAVTSELLQDAGYDVIEAADGEEALRLLEDAGVIDLLLSDMVMPRLSGSGLAELVRQSHPSLPIIFCTGYAPAAFNNHPRLAGTQLIAKPFNGRELVASVQAALEEAPHAWLRNANEGVRLHAG